MTDNIKKQKLLDNGRHELINSKFNKDVEALTQVLESDQIHKLALTSRETAHLKLERIMDAVGDFDRAIEFSAATEDIASSIHSHSAYAESLQEAAMAA